VRKRIALAVESGSSYAAAAEFASVTDRTMRSWLARGRAEQDARKPDRTERCYVLLLEAVELASARAEVRAAATITRAAQEDWRAALAFLERRSPAEWGKRLAVEHSDEPAPTFEKLFDLCTDEELELLQAVLGRERRPS
jgi:hypothetical protein